MPDNNDILQALRGSPLFAPPTKGGGLDQSSILNMLMAPNKRPFILGGGPKPATITGGMGPNLNYPGMNFSKIPWENSSQDLSDTARFEHKKPLKKTLGDDYLSTWASPYSTMPLEAANRVKTDKEKYNYAVMDQKLRSLGRDPDKMTDVEKVLAILKQLDNNGQK